MSIARPNIPLVGGITVIQNYLVTKALIAL